jgi:flagellar biosynthesis anti-sigma factor FlgM
MKVTNNRIGSSSLGKTAGSEALSKDTKTKGPSSAVDRGQIKDSANVNVSERAQMMQKVKDVASAGMNDVDEAKVSLLQKLIDEGKYNVDAQSIADRLVDSHMEIPD